MQYYYFVIVAGIYLGTNTHTDDASAKLNIPTILLEQFGLQNILVQWLSTRDVYFIHYYLKGLFALLAFTLFKFWFVGSSYAIQKLENPFWLWKEQRD